MRTETYKKYLHCIVTTNDGRVFENPLKLSEARLISQMAQENKSVLVTTRECTQQYYEMTFG